MVGLKNGHICKNSLKKVNPRDTAGERRRRMVNPRELARECWRRRRPLPSWWPNGRVATLWIGSRTSLNTSDGKIGAVVSTMSDAWSYRVSIRTGLPGDSMLLMDGKASLSWHFYLSVAACQSVLTDPFLRTSVHVVGMVGTKKQAIVLSGKILTTTKQTKAKQSKMRKGYFSQKTLWSSFLLDTKISCFTSVTLR